MGITWGGSCSSHAGPASPHSLDLVEVDTDIIIGIVSFHCHVYGSLVDARRLGQLSVLLEVSGLVRIILVDDVHLCVNDGYRLLLR